MFVQVMAHLLLFHSVVCSHSRLALLAHRTAARFHCFPAGHSPAWEVEVDDTGPEDAHAIARIVNWAHRGKFGGDRNSWTSERHLLSGMRTTADAVREQIQSGRQDGKEHHWLMARTDARELVGAVSVRVVSCGVTEISMLSIDPDMQALGLGTVLLSFAECRAASFGTETCEMFVIDSRAELLQWFARKGYTPCTDTLLPFPADDGLGTPRADVGELRLIRLTKDFCTTQEEEHPRELSTPRTVGDAIDIIRRAIAAKSANSTVDL